jgi:hypothetical protein
MGRSLAAGAADGACVMESVDDKGMLLMVVFKQSQIASTPHYASQTDAQREWVKMRFPENTRMRGGHKRR